MRQILFTQTGYQDYQKQYEIIVASRPAAVEDLRKAREMGDLSENGYYKAARMKLSSIDATIRRLRNILHQAVIANRSFTDRVEIGCRVILKPTDGDLIEYQIVGELEADPSQHKISLQSPMGQALKNKKGGDIVTVTLPRKTISFSLLTVK